MPKNNGYKLNYIPLIQLFNFFLEMLSLKYAPQNASCSIFTRILKK